MQTVEGEEVGEVASRKEHRSHGGRRVARLLARKEGVKHAHPPARRDHRAQHANCRVTEKTRFLQLHRWPVSVSMLTLSPGRRGALWLVRRRGLDQVRGGFHRAVVGADSADGLTWIPRGAVLRSAVGEPRAGCCPDGLSSRAPTVRKGRGAGLPPRVPVCKHVCGRRRRRGGR